MDFEAFLLPASYAQQGQWLVNQRDPRNSAYNIPVSMRLSGPLNVALLEQALNAIVQRHEVLRTTYRIDSKELVQVISPALRLALPVLDLKELPESERETEARERLAEEAWRPFDLARGPLLRAMIFRLSTQEHLLLLTMHHIVIDAWSLDILFRELSTLYSAFGLGKPDPLPSLPIQYGDFAVWQRQWLQGEVLENHLSYWKKQLSAIPVLELPTDRSRPAVHTYSGARQSVLLPEALCEQLKVISRKEGTTLFMTFLSAFQILLYRYTGQEDIAVGSPIAGRTRPETEGLLGFFVNTLVLRSDLSGNPTFRELLARVRKVTLGAFQHQEVPFEKLVQELNPERVPGRNPLYEVVFNFLDSIKWEMQIPGLAIRDLSVHDGPVKFDLTFYLRPAENGFTVVAEYSVDLFDAATIARMIIHYRNLLEDVVASPDRRLTDLRMLNDAERHQLLFEWNDTDRDYVKDNSVHHCFESQVEKSPDAVAVVFEDRQLTYGELNERANSLASYLQSLGVGPEIRVALYLDRSLELVVGLLGVLKAGGAYVPIDPRNPAQHTAILLADSEPKILLTREPFTKSLPGGYTRTICLDRDWEAIAGQSSNNLSVKCAPDNLAYVIYTSGSTGKPKGVGIPHRALTNFLESMRQQPGLTNHDILLSVTTPSFDILGMELYLPLMVGACIVLANRETAFDGMALAQLLKHSKITAMQATPATWRLLLQGGWSGGDGFKILCGGDELSRNLADALLVSGASVWNLYGPTETTIWSTVWKAQLGPEQISIGRPIANTQVYILDDNLRPLPVSTEGEVYIGGDGLARGYFNQPDLTAERFLPNPFSRKPGGRIYRTGDLARQRLDGRIELRGRTDHQVKLRGFRIETGDIEALLRQHISVQEVVVALDESPQSRRIIAYVVRKQGHNPSVSELQNFLRLRLPDYMVPSAFVFLRTLPLTSNGKVDRRALPTPDQSRPALEVTFVAPRDIVEELVTKIWSEVLNLAQVGINDNFFDLGGHSLLAIQLISQLNETFNTELSLTSLFESPTPEALAAIIASADHNGNSLPPRLPASVAGDRKVSLSFAEQGLWLIDQLRPGMTAFNMQSSMRLGGTLDIPVLERSLNALIQRHDALRTSFQLSDETPARVVVQSLTMQIPVIELSSTTNADEEISRIAAEQKRRPFELSKAPLLRINLVRIGENEHILLLTMHHIITDAWSRRVFFRELLALYDAYSSQKPSPLPHLPLQYSDYMNWLRLAARVNEESHLSYWKTKLDGATVAELPCDKDSPGNRTFLGAAQQVVLSDEAYRKLKELCKEERSTLFMVLLAAFKALLYRFTGKTDIVVGSTIAGRNRPEVKNLVGFLINLLPLRSDLSNQLSFRDVVKRVRSVCLSAFQHQDMPFERLVEVLNPDRDLDRHPFFQVLFNFVNLPEIPRQASGLTVESLSRPDEIALFDIMFQAVETMHDVTIRATYNTDLFSHAWMGEMLEQYKGLVEQVVADPDCNIEHYSLLTSAARKVLPDPTTPLDQTWKGAVHEFLRQHAQTQPDKVAIADIHGSWTYRQLDRHSNQLAQYLLAGRVGREDIIAIYGYRSVALVWAIMGIFKAGAAFCILDPAHPGQRLADYLTLVKPKALIQIGPAEELQQVLNHHPFQLHSHLTIPQDSSCNTPEVLSGFSSEDPDVQVNADDLAYVVFTSGTTGSPKAVLGRHGPLTHFVPWEKETFNISEDDRFSLLTGLSSNLIQREIFTALSLGATILIPDVNDIASFGDIDKWIDDNAITAVHLTPAMGRLVHDISHRQMPSVRRIFFGGDSLTKGDVRQIREVMPNADIIGFYGSSETQRAVGYTIGSSETANLAKEVLPIGRGVRDVQLLILNSISQIAGVGERGEICIRSPHLARGYLGDDDLTWHRFALNPFTNEEGDLVYRTGEWGRYLPDGNVEFVARSQNQVSIRGFRVDLGEVETVLKKHSSVAQAAVSIDKGRTEQMIAHIVVRRQHALSVAELRNFLKARLPNHMIPTALVMLDALPLTPSGKLDRKALVPPSTIRQSDIGHIPPSTLVEESLVDLWTEVLGIDRIGVHDDFFDLGGHSLSATKIISHIRKLFLLDLPLRTLFEKRTIAELAAAISKIQCDGAASKELPAMLADLDLLSEEEAEKFLKE